MYMIRKSQNVSLVHALHKEIMPADSFYDHDGNHYWIVYIRQSKKPIGFAIGTNLGDGIFFLSRAGVLSAWRGQGLHKRLIKVREEFAKKWDFNYCITYVKQTNPQSFSSLMKCGYEVYQPDFPYGTKNSLYFRKLISEW